MKPKNSTEQNVKENKEKKNQPRTVKVVFMILFSVLFFYAGLQGQSYSTSVSLLKARGYVVNGLVFNGVRLNVSGYDVAKKINSNNFINYSRLDGTLVVVKSHSPETHQ